MTEHHEKSVGPNEEARAASAALREKGWKPITPDRYWAGELAVGRSADGAYEASLWASPNVEPGTRWLCDVGVTPPDAEKEALWLYGIPRPEEVPALLKRHADILSVGIDDYVLDLASGEVIARNENTRRTALDLKGAPVVSEDELHKLGDTEPLVGINLGGPYGLITVARTGEEPIRCVVELEEDHSIVRVEAGGEEVCEHRIEGPAPEVMVRRVADARNGAA